MVIIGIKRVDKKTTVFGIQGIVLCRTFQALTQTELYAFLKVLDCTVDAAIISFYQPYRNTLYALFPSIKIAIFKDEIIELFDETLEEETLGYDEIAASADGLEAVLSGCEIGSFINTFYKSSDKDQALTCYETWQTYIPLNNKKIYRLVRIMEFYSEEILNYFDMQFLLGSSKIL